MNERFRRIGELLSPNQQSWMERADRLSREDLTAEAQRTQLLGVKFVRVAERAGGVGIIGIPLGLLGILPMPVVVVVGAAVVSAASQYIGRNLGVREHYLSQRARLVSATAGGFTPGAV